MPAIDFAQLRNEIKNVAQRAFTEVRAAHAAETFYAFALYSDESAMTVEPAANSEEALQRKIHASGDPSSAAWYRWGTGEWAYEHEGSTHFTAAYNMLNGQAADAAKEEDFEGFKTQVFETMVQALGDLDQTGFFGVGKAREAITLFCSISDSDDAEELENDSAQQLNPAGVYQQFAARFQGSE